MSNFCIAIIAIITGLLVMSISINIRQRSDMDDLEEKLSLRDLTISELHRTLDAEIAKNKIKPRMLREEKLTVAEVIVETTVDRFVEDAIDSELVFKLGEAVWKFAKTERMENPADCTVRGRAFVRVVDKR